MDIENISNLDRASKIIDIIREKVTVSVGYLSELFHVSGTTIRTDLTRLEEAMIASSRTIYLLSDSSKMGQVDFQRFASLEDIDVFITDQLIAPEMLQKVQEQIETTITI